MLLKILKFISYLLKIPINWLSRINNFILPNLAFIYSKRIMCANQPICIQKLRLTGAGSIEIGKDCHLGYKLGGFYYGGAIEIQPRYKKSKIKLGNNIATNNNVFICGANYIEVGNNVLIGQNVTIMDHEAHGIEPDKRRTVGKIGKVIIEDNVWIGNNVTILKDSRIGENTIVATSAVVSGIFPANVIIGGVPAKIIKAL